VYHDVVAVTALALVS